MALHTIRKGLNLPIEGGPEQTVYEGAPVSHAGVLGEDYVGLKPTILAAVGDTVQRGQPLFEDKKNPGVICTAPAAGTVVAINRGDKRAFLSMVIKLNAREQQNEPNESDFFPFENYEEKDPAGLSGGEVRTLLIESGLWTAFRTRPMSKVPAVDSEPAAIFITAMDSNPHAPSVEAIYAGNEGAFDSGLTCISKLREGKIYLCREPGSAVSADPHSGVQVEEFSGVHPAGTPGVHIHILEGVHREKTVWHIGIQDVIAIGQLFATGRLEPKRIVSLAGPAVVQPRMLSTRMGAGIDALTAGEIDAGENRIISGSVLSGRTANGEVVGYLGRYHQQIAALAEGREREFLGWLSPGADKFSTTNSFLAHFSPSKLFKFTTATNGSERPMVPIGMYERVMPMDILPTYLLRALLVGDLELAEKLGCLDLDEEDLALCTFVCPGKYDYAPHLRNVLTQIEREG
jgi:Na+-transporting NADH:ubiquinone oxidoreductase subunit A